MCQCLVKPVTRQVNFFAVLPKFHEDPLNNDEKLTPRDEETGKKLLAMPFHTLLFLDVIRSDKRDALFSHLCTTHITLYLLEMSPATNFSRASK